MINDYLSQATALLEQAQKGAEKLLFSPESAFQITIIVLVLMISQAAQGRMRRGFSYLSGQIQISWLSSVIKRLEAVAPPLTAFTLLWVITGFFKEAARPYAMMKVAVSLISVWVVIRFTSTYVGNRTLARWIALLAWAVAALNILDMLEPTMHQLDAIGVTVGKTKVTMLLVIKGLLTFAALLWGAVALGAVTERRIYNMTTFTPSLRVLIVKVSRTLFVITAMVLGLNALGIDLTSLAVFSGAIGLGLGFGLQKVVSNFISGIILLLDRSIKPGDVIHIGDTYGWVNALGARYVSLITRDGKEHLIPNELLITERVENWSYSNRDIRIRIPVGISYDSDVRKALELMTQVAQEHPRILKNQAINALVTGFGESSVDLELRAWIDDPANGIGNITSEIMLGIWDAFHTNGIAFPYRQTDIHIKPDSVIKVVGQEAS